MSKINADVEWMKTIREQFGEFEFMAISPQNNQVKSLQFDLVNIPGEGVIPIIENKETNNDRLATSSPQHLPKNAATTRKSKTRQG